MDLWAAPPGWLRIDNPEEHPMTTRFAAIALAALTLATAACNTVEGAGEDLQSASREVKEEI